VPIYTRHPIVMAQQALTTQAAVGGRLLLGIGLAHKPVVEQRWGLSFDRPVEYMQEYLAILLPLLRGEAVEYTGNRLRAQAQLSIADASPPMVILAALGERMLRLAGALTEGTALWLVGPRTLASHVRPVISEAAQHACRPAPRILVGLPICVTDYVAGVRERVARDVEHRRSLILIAVGSRQRAFDQMASEARHGVLIGADWRAHDFGPAQALGQVGLREEIIARVEATNVESNAA